VWTAVNAARDAKDGENEDEQVFRRAGLRSVATISGVKDGKMNLARRREARNRGIRRFDAP